MHDFSPWTPPHLNITVLPWTYVGTAKAVLMPGTVTGVALDGGMLPRKITLFDLRRSPCVGGSAERISGGTVRLVAPGGATQENMALALAGKSTETPNP